jgi:hypothetical protein
MGSKGSQTANTGQTSTYYPSGVGYLTGALNQATGLSNQGTPTIPTAPVAGFNQAQQSAFGTVNNLQGGYQPYINQAQNYFQQGTQPDVSQFFNPYAGAVTAQMQNIFGQQQQQNNASLTQAAGGVGADRIAVGQGNLANQQGLAAGQTLAGLYQPALGAAQQQENIQQGAGYGVAGLGAQAQNLGIQGAQAQLGTGGLQQQLSQAQLNAPYQQQLAQMALPYQLSQWYSGQAGALAPALGGTTSGFGTQQSQYNPSLFSQIAGVGLLGGGILGKGGGGAVPYARGGNVNPYAFDDGGATPIDVSGGLFGGKRLFRLPDQAPPPAQTHVPQLNLNPQTPNMSQQGQQDMKTMQALGKSLGSGYNNSTSNLFGMSNASQDWLDDAGLLARGGAANPYRLQHFDGGGGAGGDGGGDGGDGSDGGGDGGMGGIGSDAGATGDGGFGGGVSGSVGGFGGDSGGFGGFGGFGGTGGIGSDAAASEGGFGAAADAAAAQAGQSGAPGDLGSLSDANFGNATADTGGFGIASLGSFGIPGVGGIPGLNSGAIGDTIGDTGSMEGFGPNSVSGTSGLGGFGFGFGTEGLSAANAVSAPNAPALSAYGPPASPSIANTLGFQQPSLSPTEQNAQETAALAAVQAAQAQAAQAATPTGLADQTTSVAQNPGNTFGNLAADFGALAATNAASPNAALGEAANATTPSAPGTPGGLSGALSGALSGIPGAIAGLPGALSNAASSINGTLGQGLGQGLAALGPVGDQSAMSFADPTSAPAAPGTSGSPGSSSGAPGGLGGLGGDGGFGGGSSDLLALARSLNAPYGYRRPQQGGYPMAIPAQGYGRGGAANPYHFADSGVVPDDLGAGLASDDDRQRGLDALRAAMLQKYGAGDAIRLDPTAHDAWANGVDADRATGQTAQATDQALPPAIGQGPDQDATALGFASPTGGATRGLPGPITAPAPSQALATRSAATASPPDAAPAATAPAGNNFGLFRDQGGLFGGKGLAGVFDNPRRVALIMAGLGAWTPQGIAGGFQQGMNYEQQAKRLEQEANFHADQMKMQQMPYEKMTKAQEAHEQEVQRQFEISRVPPGYQRTPTGMEPVPGGPADPSQVQREAAAKRLPAMAREDMQPLVDAYLAGDHSVMSGIGRGSQGPQNIEQFWNMTAERLRAQGADGRQIAAAKANFTAESAAAKTAAVREVNVQTAINEARGTFPQLLQRSQELQRTDFVPFNKFLEFGRNLTGNEAQRKYGTAMQAVITAYSQAMSRTGANSVHAQQHAEDLLNRADPHTGIKAVLEQMDQEMAIAKSAPAEARQEILERILGFGGPKGGGGGGGPGATPQATGTPAAPARTVVRQGTINTGANAGKRVIEYSDGTRDIQ